MMSFALITDSAANLTAAQLEKYAISVIPLSYTWQGEELTCLDPGAMDGVAFYESLRKAPGVKTSLINSSRFEETFRIFLAQGLDILYISVSSGISGTHQAACAAARALREEFPLRDIRIFDTYAASFGEGLQVCKAARLRHKGLSLEEIVERLTRERLNMHQIFTVEDLMYLRRGGRVSSISAVIGTVLHIMPLLTADHAGHIVVYGKARGRRRALQTLAEELARDIRHPEDQTVAIAHCGCPADAEALANMIRERVTPREIFIEYYEPVTGSHVGPGAVALFFEGDERAAQ